MKFKKYYEELRKMKHNWRKAKDKQINLNRRIKRLTEKQELHTWENTRRQIKLNKRRNWNITGKRKINRQRQAKKIDKETRIAHLREYKKTDKVR